MEESTRKEEQPADGTELERSGSGVPAAGAADAEPHQDNTPDDDPDDGDTSHQEEPGSVREAEWPRLEDEPELHKDLPTDDIRIPRLMSNFNTGRKKSRVAKLQKKDKGIACRGAKTYNPEQRLLLLDTWTRSGLPAKDFGGLVGVSPNSLYKWKKDFARLGPEGLHDGVRGVHKGSKLPESAKRAVLMIKENNPEFGIERLSDMLYRGLSISVSPQAISNFLKGEGYQLEPVPTKRHPDKVRRFERARPNQLWQTDLFTFMMKRQNRRVHLVTFMDDNSRFIVGYGLNASASAALVLECLRTGITSYGTPEEILTDNGAQYITWRGKSRFVKECEKRGINHIVATPRRPQTLGKVERFWGTLWRECLEHAIFLDMGDARKRIGLFIDYYNFQRTHQGIDGLVPADRFFHAAPEVLNTLKESVEANSLEFARQGVPKAPFYMTGNLGGKRFSVHAEGERVIMVGEDGVRQEVDMVPPEQGEEVIIELPEPVSPDGSIDNITCEPEPEPGTSPLDEGLEKIAASIKSPPAEEDNAEGQSDGTEE